VIRPRSAPSIISAGDSAQLPRQYTGSIVIAPSREVCLNSTPSRRVSRAASASLPIAWQASARHSLSTCRPGGEVRKS
jgi:hypothetical protein